jgi:hypothetical protein
MSPRYPQLFELTGTSAKEWTQYFEQAIAEFLQSLRNPRDSARSQLLLYERTVGVLLEVNQILPVPVSLIRENLGVILGEQLQRNPEYETVLTFYTELGIDLVRQTQDLITSGTSEDVLQYLLVVSHTQRETFEESIGTSETGRPIRLNLKRESDFPALQVDLKSIGSISEIRLFKFGLSLEDLDLAVRMLLEQSDHILLDYQSCMAALVQIQITLTSIIGIIGNDDPCLGDFAAFFYFILPDKLKHQLQRENLKESFIMTIIYPNVVRGPVAEYKTYTSWIKDSRTKEKEAYRKSFDSKLALEVLIKDFTSKQELENTHPAGLMTDMNGIRADFRKREDAIKSTRINLELTGRYQGYLFASQIVSCDSVFALLIGIFLQTGTFLCGSGRYLEFTKGFIKGFNGLGHFPVDFVRMVEIATLLITRTDPEDSFVL